MNLLLFGFLILAGLVGWGILETFRLRVVRTDFSSMHVPQEFEGFRIVLMGGLHLRRSGSWTIRLSRELKKLDGDLLVIAGNVKPTHAADNRQVHQILQRLLDGIDYPDEILCVRGYRDRKRFWDEIPSGSCLKLLSNSSHTIGRKAAILTFIGLQTAHASHLDRGINQLREVLAGIEPLKPEADFRILIGQSADLLRVAQGQPIHLILAADNLHYQVRLPGIGIPRRDTKVPWSWDRGWIREGRLWLYLTTGVGIRWLPFRFFMRPEIVAITLRRTAPPEGRPQ